MPDEAQVVVNLLRKRYHTWLANGCNKQKVKHILADRIAKRETECGERQRESAERKKDRRYRKIERVREKESMNCTSIVIVATGADHWERDVIAPRTRAIAQTHTHTFIHSRTCLHKY